VHNSSDPQMCRGEVLPTRGGPYRLYTTFARALPERARRGGSAMRTPNRLCYRDLSWLGLRADSTLRIRARSTRIHRLDSEPRSGLQFCRSRKHCKRIEGRWSWSFGDRLLRWEKSMLSRNPASGSKDRSPTFVILSGDSLVHFSGRRLLRGCRRRAAPGVQ
jgi:hypothetical protein